MFLNYKQFFCGRILQVFIPEIKTDDEMMCTFQFIYFSETENYLQNESIIDLELQRKSTHQKMILNVGD